MHTNPKVDQRTEEVNKSTSNGYHKIGSVEKTKTILERITTLQAPHYAANAHCPVSAVHSEGQLVRIRSPGTSCAKATCDPAILGGGGGVPARVPTHSEFLSFPQSSEFFMI